MELLVLRPFESLVGLDRLVHEPARLAVLTWLSCEGTVEFTSLVSSTGLSRGNLSSHLGALCSAGLVVLDREFVGDKPCTRVRLTALGRERLLEYESALALVSRSVAARGRAHQASSAPPEPL